MLEHHNTINKIIDYCKSRCIGKNVTLVYRTTFSEDMLTIILTNENNTCFTCVFMPDDIAHMSTSDAAFQTGITHALLLIDKLATKDTQALDTTKANMYLVLKKKDIEAYLTEDEQISLNVMTEKIAKARSGNGKTPCNKYHVCNVDEPYADRVHKDILLGEALKRLPDDGACGSSDFY